MVERVGVHRSDADESKRSELAATERSSTAKRSLTERRYGGALGPLVQRNRGDGATTATATIDDVATVAVEHKGAGRPVDATVRAPVEAHLGVDLSRAQVHDDPLAREASAAMGARAFAYGSDVFLGPGESGADLGLMAHELTHVAQQGGGGATPPQRKVTVGASDSPAEAQADQVAGAVTSGSAAPAALIVDDGPVQAGQMLKSTFAELLHAAVTAAAREELGVFEAVIGCPYIDRYFGRYGAQPAAAVQQLLHRYAPASRTSTAAADMIPLVVERVRAGVQHWRDTGETPPDIAAADPSAAAAASAAAPAEGGQPLDGGTASRMSNAFGASFDAVRIHTDDGAAALAQRHDAAAFTAGQHVFFARGEYQPGAPAGDALIAHELGHTLQQGGASIDKAMLLRGDTTIGSPALEADADQAAGGVMTRLYSGLRAGASAVQTLLRSDVGLQRCGKNEKKDKEKGGPEIAMTKEAMGEYEKAGMAAANSGQSLTSGIHYDYNYERMCTEQKRPDLWKEDYRTGFASPDYFDRLGFMSWKLKVGKSASEGVKAWLKGLTIAECTSTVTVLEADGVRAALGDKRFDELFGGTDGKAPEVEQLILGQAGSTDRYLKGVGKAPGDPVGKIGDRPAELGTLYYFKNHPSYPLKHPGGAWRGENAFYMGKDADGNQIWEGLGAKKTEKKMLEEMVAAYDGDRDAADQRELDQIKAANGGKLPPQYDVGGYPEKVETVDKLLAAGGGLDKGGLQVDIEAVKRLAK